MPIPFITINLDKPRHLRFGMGTMIEFEQVSGKKLMGLNVEAELPLEFIAQLLWVMLKQEDPELTQAQVLALVDEYSDLTTAVNAVTAAIQAAFPSGESRPNGKAPADKRT